VPSTSFSGGSDMGETTTVGVSLSLYWRVLEAAKGNRELNSEDLRQAEEAIEEALVQGR
jgi:hypothetical protein